MRRGPIFAGVLLSLLMLAVPAVVLATQQLGTGYLEICKVADSPAVTGAFEFVVAGRTVTVPVGACSSAIELPAGPTTVTEVVVEGVSLAAVSAIPAGRLVSSDLPAGRAVVTIAAGDVSAQTTVSFTNHAELATMKICKVAGDGVAVGRTFTFTAGVDTVPVQAGPAPGGYCAIAGSFPIASTLTVTESVPRGMRVAAIEVAPPDRVVGPPNGPGGSVAVRIGAGVTEVTFTNQLAPLTTTTLPVVASTTTLPVVATVPLPASTTTTLPATTTTAAPPAATTTTTSVPASTTTTSPSGGVLPVVSTTTTVAPGTTTSTVPGALLPTTTVAPATTTTLPASSLLPTTTLAPTTTTTTAPLGTTTTTVPTPTPTTTTVVPTTATTSPGAPPPTDITRTPSVPGPGPGGPAPQVARARPGGLALTGAGSARLALLGGLALLVGGLLLWADRRRRPQPVEVPADDDPFPALTHVPVVSGDPPVPVPTGDTSARSGVSNRHQLAGVAGVPRRLRLAFSRLPGGVFPVPDRRWPTARRGLLQPAPWSTRPAPRR